MTTVIPKIGLTTPQWNTYKGALFRKEAGPAGYQSIGGAGGRYIGGYQISDSALVGAGYLRPGSATGTPGYAWKNDQNWLKPNGQPITPGIRNYQDFLNSPQAQDDALLKFTQRNAVALSNYGILNDNLSAPERGGELAAAHLLGARGRYLEGLSGRDGFGTSARTYYNDIAKAIGQRDRTSTQTAAQERIQAEVRRELAILDAPGSSSSLVTANDEYYKPSRFFPAADFQYSINQQPVFRFGSNPELDKIPKMFVNGREVSTTIDLVTGEVRPTAPLGLGEKIITWRLPGYSESEPNLFKIIPSAAARQQAIESVGDPAFADYEIKFVPRGATALNEHRLDYSTVSASARGTQGVDFREVVLVNDVAVNFRYEPWKPNPAENVIVITTPLPIGPHVITVNAVDKDGNFLATGIFGPPKNLLVAENPEDVRERTNKPNPTDIRLAAGTQTSTAFPSTESRQSGVSSSNQSSSGLAGNYGIGTNVPVKVAGPNGSNTGQVTPLVPNPLHDFQSYTYLFTFSSLTSEQVNFPTNSYLKGDLGKIIFSSAGRYSENRVKTAYQNPDNPSGKYDFFIDNVVMEHLVVPTVEIGSTNLLNIKFEVTEPYSVGQFLQACQIAATNNGHYSYIDSPFLLTLEFKGYVDNTVKTIENTIRYFPVKIRSVTLSISDGGAKYQVDVIAWTDQAFDDEYNILKQDSVISGKDVVEMLQTGERSLQAIVNKRLKEIAELNNAKKYVPNEIAIVFPSISETPVTPPTDARGATVSQTAIGDPITKIGSRNATSGLIVQAASAVNKIGNSKFKFDAATGGDLPKQPDEPTIIKNFTNGKHSRSSFNNDTGQREFTFRKQTSIVNAITEALLLSEFCDDIRKQKKDANGFYDWFKIESQVYQLEPNNENKAAGVFPKLLVYRIIPYKVHSYKFEAPDVTAQGYQAMANQVSKEYNYIYTGKNIDVLDFKLNLNVNFASNLLADGLGVYSNSPLLSRLGKSGAGFESSASLILDPPKTPANSGAGDTAVGIATQRTMPVSPKNSDGAGLANTYLSNVARVFQDRILNSDAELVSATLSIIGDPYYLSYSGTGNYSVSDYTSSKNITPLGSFDYQKGEVDILINFLTPVDLSNSGRMLFEKDIDTSLEVPFSGLYFIRSVNSTFSRGKFTQDLAIVRRPNQNTIGIAANATGTDLSNIAEPKASGAVSVPDQRVSLLYIPGAPIVGDSYTDYAPPINTA